MKGLKDRIRMSPCLRWLLVVSNWFSQSIIHADRTEKIYKISFSILASIFFITIFIAYFKLSWAQSIIVGAISGHSMNWVINSNFYNIFVHRLLLSCLDKKNAFSYLDSLADRLKGSSSILYATTHGSICNGNLKTSSDIDVALVRNKGFINGIRAIYFVVSERKIADWRRIPLEIHLTDSPAKAIARFKKEKNPVVIHDPGNTIDKYYSNKLSIAEARNLNGL